MFITYFNTYLAKSPKGLTQQLLCALPDAQFPPALEEDLQDAGYNVISHNPTEYSILHPKQGYLTLTPDMALSHQDAVSPYECFRSIDPSILPPPPKEIPFQEEISKNIHQIGVSLKNPGEYPKIFHKNKMNIIKNNQEYKFQFWTENGYYNINEFIIEHYGEDFLQYFNSINPLYGAAKADLFRYLCLYIKGGVYLDLKSSFALPLHTIIKANDRLLLSFWYHCAKQHPEVSHLPYGEYEQYYIICAAGHPIMRRLIHQVMCNIRIYNPIFNGTGMKGTLLTTGPLTYSLVMEKYRNKETTRQIHSLTNGIEYTIFENHDEHKAIFNKNHYSDRRDPIILSPNTLPGGLSIPPM